MCTLYDIGPIYLVLELVEGETLAARLGKGTLPLDEMLLEGFRDLAAGVPVEFRIERSERGVEAVDVSPF